MPTTPSPALGRADAAVEQHPEVYVMPAEAGQGRRLAWLGTDTLVR